MEQIIINCYQVNWLKAELVKGDTIKPIEAKHLVMLKLLAQANGNIVSQQQMLDVVWESTIVSPNTIQQAITQLRKLLDDDGRNQKAIKTHPKLGYSLIFKTSHSPTKTKTTNKKLPTIFLMVMALLVLLMTLFMFSHQTTQKKRSVEKIVPITVQGEVVKSVALNKQSHDIYYLVKNNNYQSLRKQNINTANFATLANNLNVFGTIALASDNKHLAFGQISLRHTENKKCITLTIFNLENNREKTLLPCSNSFHHSPTWLNGETLIYTSTDKNRSNTLHTLNTQTLVQAPLILNTRHVNSYDAANNKLAIIADDSLLVFKLADNNNKPALITSIALAENFHHAKVRWLSDNSLAIFNENTVKTMALNGDSRQFSLPELQQVNDLIALSEHHYIAIIGQQNWSTRERNLFNQIDTEIGASNYRESKAKYSAAGDSIYYLSDRSGSQQIWQQTDERVTQITDVSSAVDDYISVFNGDSLLFVSNNKLWLQAQGLDAVDLNIKITPVRLYQADNQQVLLSAKVNNVHQLIRLNLKTKQWHVLLNKEVNWAQYISQDIFITNNATGQLEKYQHGKLTKINALPSLTLQWRYFWRADNQGAFALYFQDKKLNIWRYEPLNDTAKIVGRYDINALFMTDYSAIKHHMLSDNFVAEQQQLVQLKTTN